MPRMLVPRPNADTPDSERKVFAALERHLPHDWTVFHSRRIVLTRKRGGSLEAELEFRIIDPARGILGLEVKGALRSAATRMVVFRREPTATASSHRCAGRAGDADPPGLPPQHARDGSRVRLGVVFPAAESREALGPNGPLDL